MESFSFIHEQLKIAEAVERTKSRKTGKDNRTAEEIIQSKLNADKLRHYFNYYDEDGSTQIDFEEFKQFWHQVDSDLKDTTLKLLFICADLDMSGMISFEEFEAIMTYLS